VGRKKTSEAPPQKKALGTDIKGKGDGLKMVLGSTERRRGEGKKESDPECFSCRGNEGGRRKGILRRRGKVLPQVRRPGMQTGDKGLSHGPVEERVWGEKKSGPRAERAPEESGGEIDEINRS